MIISIAKHVHFLIPLDTLLTARNKGARNVAVAGAKFIQPGWA
jgi:hypothetical protein